MKILLSIVCIFTISCINKNDNTSKVKLTSRDSIFFEEGFDTAISYSESCCLYYKGKPLLTVGQNIKQLDTSFSFRYDPNGKYKKHFLTIKDYLSSDDFYSAELSTGSIIGTLYFSADNKGRVFRIAGDWSIDGDLVDTSGMEIMRYVYDKYFPCLPPDFKGKQTFEMTHKNFIENFKLNYIPARRDNKHEQMPHWSLSYSVILTKKSGT